jgi:hypothetical protein
MIILRGTILRDELARNFCVALMRDVIAGHYSRAGMLLVGVISKIKQNSSDMNEILLAPCDAGYVQNCTGFTLLWQISFINKKVAQCARLYTQKNYSPKIKNRKNKN